MDSINQSLIAYIQGKRNEINFTETSQKVVRNLWDKTDEYLQSLGREMLGEAFVTIRHIVLESSKGFIGDIGMIEGIVFHLSDSAHNMPDALANNNREMMIHNISQFLVTIKVLNDVVLDKKLNCHIQDMEEILNE